MRQAVEEYLASYDAFFEYPGSAESTTLPGMPASTSSPRSMRFHWF